MANTIFSTCNKVMLFYLFPPWKAVVVFVTDMHCNNGGCSRHDGVLVLIFVGRERGKLGGRYRTQVAIKNSPDYQLVRGNNRRLTAARPEMKTIGLPGSYSTILCRRAAARLNAPFIFDGTTQRANY
jgi:hypothetical protein